MKGIQRILAVAVIGALLATFPLGSTATLSATGCPKCPTPASDEKVAGVPNPTAAYCRQLGYQYDVREDEEGNQYGVCVFPDGSECNACDFFKGKCGKDYSYCARKGYDIETERVNKGSYYTECAVCVSGHGEEEIRIPMLELMEENGEPLIDTESCEVKRSSKHKECTECEASNMERSSKDDGLPTTFDWRNVDGHTYIGPIRDQGACGSCYAFAAAASAEGTYNWAMGNYDDNCADFSESFIIWCLGRLPEYYDHFYGCAGADYDYYELEALTVEGVCNESDFPYTVYDPGECTHWGDTRMAFSSWDRILCNDIDAIKTAIMTYGVVDAAVMATTSFSSYSGGIYTDSNTSCYSSPCYYTPTNHAIALVGWGHDDVYGDYWVLRNSWGADWGEDGYMRIAVTSALVACEATYLTSSATPVLVSIDAPDEAAPDSDFTANISISEVTDFDACNYDVSFDASVLQLDNVTSGLIGSTEIPVDIYSEISSGTYRVIQNVSGLTGVSGSGYLAVLHFHVIGSEGDSSTISLSNGMLANNLAEEIEATWVGDSVDVVTPPVLVSIDAPDEVASGSDFTADINISEVVDFDSCNYDVSFDASVLQLDNVTSGLIGSTEIPVDMYNEIGSGTYRIIQNVPGLSGVSGSGYLAVLHFHVIGSQGDSSTISLSNGVLSNNLAEEITATWTGDSVNVTLVPGDATGDGVVDSRDITKVERIIAGLDAETPGADATQDGVIDSRDITKIEIIIAGLD